MLVIRKQQLEAFAKHRGEDFERRLRTHLGSLLSEARIDIKEHELEEQVGLGIASGRKFFQTEKDLARYCEIVLLKLGGWKGKDHAKPAIEMLGTKAIDAEVRLNNFERWATLYKG